MNLLRGDNILTPVTRLHDNSKDFEGDKAKASSSQGRNPDAEVKNVILCSTLCSIAIQFSVLWCLEKPAQMSP